MSDDQPFDAMVQIEKLRQEYRDIYILEQEILKHGQTDMPVDHEFCNGVYARTMHIPAGTVLTGAVHKDESFFVMRSGRLVVTSSNGVKLLVAGDMSITPARCKRAGVAITDVVCTTFHPNPDNISDPDALWSAYTIDIPLLKGVTQ